MIKVIDNVILQQNRSRPGGRQPHALNMERLWAGDYSQLPAGQQLHALNLSAQQQQAAWLGQHQGHKVIFKVLT